MSICKSKRLCPFAYHETTRNVACALPPADLSSRTLLGFLIYGGPSDFDPSTRSLRADGVASNCTQALAASVKPIRIAY